jgi:hypothetical protein
MCLEQTENDMRPGEAIGSQHLKVMQYCLPLLGYGKHSKFFAL